MTLDEIGRRLKRTNKDVRNTLTRALETIGGQLRQQLHLGNKSMGIDVTDTAHLLRQTQIDALGVQLNTATTLLDERTQALRAAGLLNQDGTGVNAFGEKAIMSLSLPVENLDFGVRCANALKFANFQFTWQIVLKTEAQLLKIKFFGRKCLSEIKEILAERGLSLGMTIPPEIQARLPAP